MKTLTRVQQLQNIRNSLIAELREKNVAICDAYIAGKSESSIDTLRRCETEIEQQLEEIESLLNFAMGDEILQQLRTGGQYA